MDFIVPEDTYKARSASFSAGWFHALGSCGIDELPFQPIAKKKKTIENEKLCIYLLRMDHCSFSKAALVDIKSFQSFCLRWEPTVTKYSDDAGETEAHDQHVRHLKISTNNILIPVVIGKQRSWKAGQSPPSPAELLSDICCCCERCGVWQYGKLHLLCIFHSKELLHSTENADIDDVQPYTSLIPLHARWTEETVALHQPFR